MELGNLVKDYGCFTFSDEVMKERIPKSTYKEFHETLKKGESLSKSAATVIANAMKIWAVENGATHYTHWFTPMTGLTAEKHDAFIEPDGGRAILEFSGKMLRKGEPDASSFPSGGLRATFEARGYTVWDCNSSAFIKDGTLYIPTLFCSYTGEALDKKTPLLRSCDALSKAATKLYPKIGLDVESITASAGAEQEYFLIDDKYYQERMDIKLTGRTLFGAMAPKGQELEDHYFGSIKRKVNAFMSELDKELWKFGIPSKTKHNEVAPAQHEVACVYKKVNVTTDNNALLMQVMQDVAKKHGLRCLLHEKPFAGVNGSGKHNNWSIITDSGVNLFDPGVNPIKNIPFLATLACTIRAVDKYADLLRMSIASAGNDHRLGANEAPPAIISIFLGDQLEAVVETICEGKEFIVEEAAERFKTGVSVVPTFSKDNTDRNRTSPFAFTGNKFEFRAVGSAQSIAGANTILNAILAESLNEMAKELDKGKTVEEVVRNFIEKHRRVIFNGNGYSKEWEEEAKTRGLSNNKNTVDALKCLVEKDNIEMLDSLGVYSKVELASRFEILLENYMKTIRVEALTSLKMVKTQLYPAGVKYLDKLVNTITSSKEAGVDVDFVKEDANKLSSLLKEVKTKVDMLDTLVEKTSLLEGETFDIAKTWQSKVLPLMNEIRELIDKTEEMVDAKYWPIPTYVDLLFGV